MKTETSYSQLIEQIKSFQVQRVIFKGDGIEYILKPEFGSKEFFTQSNVVEDGFFDILRSHGVQYENSGNDSGALETILGLTISVGALIGTLFALRKFSDVGGGGLGMGMGKAKVNNRRQTGISFADVAGVDEAKQELQEVVDFLSNAEKYRKIGAKIPKGILLVGPPGTGKTLLAKAVAGEAGVPFLSMSGSEFVEVYVGVGASRVRDLFARAKQQSPCIVFIDELDAIGKARGSNPNLGNDEREQTLNQLLTEMDGFSGNDGVIVIAATNRPEILDAALRRPGRFDRQVLLDRPDKSGRLDILRVHSASVALAEDVDLDILANQTFGFSGADLANLVNEAALLAARENSQVVLMKNFHDAFERIVAGLEKRSRVPSILERRIVAYHEVGHALVGALADGGSRVSKISIVPRGSGALGYTLQMPEEDRYLMLEDELQARLATLLGGRAAEEIVFGKVSTGASDDIQKSTDLAERAVTRYGMSSTLGPIAFERTASRFLDEESPRRAISEEVAGEIDRQVRQKIELAYQKALNILRNNRDLLESTTITLLQQEVLEGEELAGILSQVKVPD